MIVQRQSYKGWSLGPQHVCVPETANWDEAEIIYSRQE